MSLVTQFGPARATRIIMAVVSSFYGVTPVALVGQERRRSVARARHVAMYLLRTDVGLSYSELGRLFGGRDHTTAKYGVSRIELKMKTTCEISRQVWLISAELVQALQAEVAA